LESNTASGYLDGTDKALNKVYLDWRNGKCVAGLGTGGAPSRIGAVSGLATKITACTGYITTIHCIL
jgi:hypothetical protein